MFFHYDTREASQGHSGRHIWTLFEFVLFIYVQVLTAYNNQLTGTIPSSIGNARQLSNFDITNNAIFGTIPASLGNITTLKYAILKFNKLTGAPFSVLYFSPLPTSLSGLSGQTSHFSFFKIVMWQLYKGCCMRLTLMLARQPACQCARSSALYSMLE